MAKSNVSSKTPRNQGNKSGHSNHPSGSRQGLTGVAKVCSRSTINRLKMHRNKTKRDSSGEIIHPVSLQGSLPSGSVARVEPNNNIKTGQSALQKFHTRLGNAVRRALNAVMRFTLLPITLLRRRTNARVQISENETSDISGDKMPRKKPNLTVTDENNPSEYETKAEESYCNNKGLNKIREDTEIRAAARDYITPAGQSKIWDELHKIIDCSDVIIIVLDARDPQGTRSSYIEEFLKKEKPHVHIVLLINKVDLVPRWVTQRYVAILSKEYPTVAFHTSLRPPFGKGALIFLLWQFAKLHKNQKQISVSVVGYPYVGKRSIISTLRSKDFRKVTQIAGETKAWQFVRRIYYKNFPVVVYNTEEGEVDIEKVLKGVVRLENISNPEHYIQAVFNQVKPEHLLRTYSIDEWIDFQDFLTQLANKSGNLLKGGEPNLSAAAKILIHDLQRGRIPFYTPPDGFETPLSRINPSQDVMDKVKDDQNSTEQSISSSKKLPPNFHLFQNFRNILVIPEFPGEEDLLDEQSLVNELESESSTKRSIESDDSSDYFPEKKRRKFEGKRRVKKNTLTSRKRRALQRKIKRKKSGSDSCDTASVKNKNRKRKRLKARGKR